MYVDLTGHWGKTVQLELAQAEHRPDNSGIRQGILEFMFPLKGHEKMKAIPINLEL